MSYSLATSLFSSLKKNIIRKYLTLNFKKNVDLEEIGLFIRYLDLDLFLENYIKEKGVLFESLCVYNYKDLMLENEDKNRIFKKSEYFGDEFR